MNTRPKEACENGERALILFCSIFFASQSLTSPSVAEELHVATTSSCLPLSVARSSTTQPSNPACYPLRDAVKTNNVVLVKLRLGDGADVNEVDLFGTPLHYAAARNSADIAMVLIDAGANLEAEAGEIQRHARALHTAARANAT